MPQTLREVLNRGPEYLAKLDRVIDSLQDITSIRTSRIDGVLSMPDVVMKRFYEMVYIYNTHFVPRGLPGVGMAIGDFHAHEDMNYLSVNLDVCLRNAQALHLFRRHEPNFRMWDAQRDSLDAKVREFLTDLDRFDDQLLGLSALQNGAEWRDTQAGWQYVGTPSPEFVEALVTASVLLSGRGQQKLAVTAHSLQSELREFSPGAAQMQTIRDTVGHKGVPRIEDGLIMLTSPSASGGSSLHNKNAYDNLMRSVPNKADFVMVAGQCGASSILHIGGGNVKGEDFVMRLPRTPFFDMVQERVDADTALIEAWKGVAHAADTVQATIDWTELTRQVKNGVISQVVPQFVEHEVLGWNMNLKEEAGVALLRPIIAASALEGNEDVLDVHNLRLIPGNVHSVVSRMGGSYYAEKFSLFDETAA